jgi:hypothetical protein
MTAPRQVVATRLYLLSRRCTQRQFLLRPSAEVEQIFLYCLGEAADRFGITLYGWIAMSNHEHLIVRDNKGNLPAFLGHLHKMIAKALNAHLGRWENFWAAEQPNAVWLLDAASSFEKLVYLLANPVADHLVERAADWPGACSLVQNLSGEPKTVRRPRKYFRAVGGSMPDTVTLRAERLEGFEHLTQKEWATQLMTAVLAQEEAARAARAKKSVRVLGRKKVLRADPTDRPKSVAARRGLRPHVASHDKERRTRELIALRDFRIAHRVARRRFSGGERGVLFPFGTYRMRDHGVRCARKCGSAVVATSPPEVT